MQVAATLVLAVPLAVFFFRATQKKQQGHHVPVQNEGPDLLTHPRTTYELSTPEKAGATGSAYAVPSMSATLPINGDGSYNVGTPTSTEV